MTEETIGITAAEIMSRRVVTVEMDDRLLLVKELFEHRKIRIVMVVDQDRLIGVLSERDLLRALSPYIGTQSEVERDTATLNRRVHQVMSRQPIVAQADSDIGEIARAFLTHDFSSVPVVSSEGQPIGLVTWRDVMEILLPRAQRPEVADPATAE